MSEYPYNQFYIVEAMMSWGHWAACGWHYNGSWDTLKGDRGLLDRLLLIAKGDPDIRVKRVSETIYFKSRPVEKT